MGVNRDPDDLAAWALDAVDAAERDAIDAELATDPERARAGRALQSVVAALGHGVSEVPPPATRASMLRAVADRPRATIEPAPPLELFRRQVATLEALLAGLDDHEWTLGAVPYEWSVHGVVAHLLAVERYMAGLLGLPAERVDGDVDDHLAMGAGLIAAELAGDHRATAARWVRQASHTTAALDARTDRLGDVVPFHGWPLPVGSLLVVRGFEIWTHADDVRRATGRAMESPPAADLRAMSAFSVGTLPLLVEQGQVHGPARIVLTGPGGGTFDLEGPPGGRVLTIVADVVDYCRAAARRIDIDRLDAVVEGDREQADALLVAARALAV